VPRRRQARPRPLPECASALLWSTGATQSFTLRPRGFAPPRRFATRTGCRYRYLLPAGVRLALPPLQNRNSASPDSRNVHLERKTVGGSHCCVSFSWPLSCNQAPKHLKNIAHTPSLPKKVGCGSRGDHPPTTVRKQPSTRRTRGESVGELRIVQQPSQPPKQLEQPPSVPQDASPRSNPPKRAQVH